MIIEEYNGVKISYPKDCGNAPKKFLLANLYKAVACNEDAFILENIKEDAIWTLVGIKEIIGIENIVSSIKNPTNNLLKIQIHNIITHGNVAAVNGIMDFKDGYSYGYADIYKFSSFGKNAKIKEITSYYILVNNK